MVSIDQPLLAPAASDDILAVVSARVAAYLSLTKPRLVLLVLVTVAVGFLLGIRGNLSRNTLVTLSVTVAGTAVVAGGAGDFESVAGARTRRPHAAHV